MAAVHIEIQDSVYARGREPALLGLAGGRLRAGQRGDARADESPDDFPSLAFSFNVMRDNREGRGGANRQHYPVAESAGPQSQLAIDEPADQPLVVPEPAEVDD